MLLKLKAFIYRHTGIYLAKREELAYLKSEDGKSTVKSLTKSFGKEGALGIAIGSWQGQNGFYRPFRWSKKWDL